MAINAGQYDDMISIMINYAMIHLHRFCDLPITTYCVYNVDTYCVTDYQFSQVRHRACESFLAIIADSGSRVV